MAYRNSRHISLQLSLYLDGRLDDEKRREIEKLIEDDEGIRREFIQLKAMQSLLASREPLLEDPFLAERVMNRIRDRAEDEDRAFAVPRRFVPVSATFIAVLLIAAALFAWLQREQIFDYVENTGTQMQQAYEETILKGWIMPLFERTDRDQVLHFAMFGTLPLDTQDGTVLRVDESADSGYRVELSNAPELLRPRTSISELYEEIQPSSVQRRVFDSLFLYAQRQIESSVLMNEEKEIAIDPAISKYHKVILSGIASTLDSGQLVRFEQFLAQRNTPYTFVSTVSHRLPSRRDKGQASDVIAHFRTVRMPEEYIVLTRDSIAQARLRLDMDSLRRLMHIVENHMPRFEVRINEIAERYTQMQPPAAPPAPPRVRVIPEDGADGRSFRIFIQTDEKLAREMEQEMKQVMREVAILRREQSKLHHREDRYPRPENPPHISSHRKDIQVFVAPDSGIQITVNIDSIMEQSFHSLDELQLFRDSLSPAVPGSDLRFEWRQIVPDARLQQIDSLLRGSDRNRQQLNRQLQELREEIMEHYRHQNNPAKPAKPDPAAPPVDRDTVFEI